MDVGLAVLDCGCAVVFLLRGGDDWIIELAGGLRVVVIDTMDRGWLEGPDGLSVEVTKIGIVGDIESDPACLSKLTS